MMTVAYANAMSEQAAEQFAEGFMDGVFGTVEGAVKCIRDLKTVASEVETTITDLKGHKYISAVEEVGTIAEGLSADIKDCEGVSPEAQQLVKQLEDIYGHASAWDVTFEVGKNVVVNGVDIYNDVTGTISSYDSGEYFTMGQDIGNGIKLAAIGHAEELGEIQEADAEQFVNGFLQGVLEGFDLPLKCIRDVKRLVTEVKTTVSDLQGHKWVGAVREVGTIAGELGGDISDCKGAVEQAETLIALAEASSGWSVVAEVGKNVLVNGVDIFNDVTGAINAYEASDYYTFGDEIGKAMHSAAIGAQVGLSTDGAEQFAEGFFEGIFGTVEGAVACMRDVKTVASEVETTIADFKSHSYISGIEEVGTIAQGLSKDIQDCEGAGPEAQQLAQQLESIYSHASAWDITFEIGKNVLVNGVDLYNDITGSISAYDSGDYSTMGRDIGNGVKEALVGKQLGLDTSGAEQFTEGFFAGVFGTVEGAVACMRDAKTVASEVETTISDFKSHSYVSGIEEVGKIASGLGKDIKDCQGDGPEAEQLAQELEDLYKNSSAWNVAFTIGKNVLVNGVDIF